MEEFFEITDEHLKLLKNSNVVWDSSEFGAPAIYSKKPYGNSDVINDIFKILEWNEVDDIENKTRQAERLHKETEIALQICLSNQKFETGMFRHSMKFYIKI